MWSLMRSEVRCLLALLLAVSAAAIWVPPVQAQVLYGSLVGTVQDNSQAVIANAKVTVTNTGTTQSRETVTSSAGTYAFTNLFPGTYTLTVSADGFRT